MGAERTPTTHLHEILLASTLKRNKDIQAKTQPATSAYILAKSLTDSLLFYRIKNVSECPMFEIMCQVATMLSPVYKETKHKEYLPAFAHGDIEAVLLILKCIQAINPEKLEELTKAQNVTEPPTKKERSTMYFE